MKNSMSLIIYIFCFGHSYAQNDDCVLNVYNGNNNIINVYSTYKLDSTINLDTLLISKPQLIQIINSLKDSIVVETINQFKTDSIFLEFQKKFLKTDIYEGFTFFDFLVLNNSLDYTEFFKQKMILDKYVGQYLNKFNLLNLSLFYFDTNETAEIYIYETGYLFKSIFEVNFKMLSNPILYSVLNKHYEDVNLLDDDLNIIGFENAYYTQTIIIPIITNKKYICDLRMVLCK